MKKRKKETLFPPPLLLSERVRGFIALEEHHYSENMNANQKRLQRRGRAPLYMINNHMQTREGETKNDFKELMYVGLFTRLYKRAAVCGKQSMRPTDVHADNLV